MRCPNHICREMHQSRRYLDPVVVDLLEMLRHDLYLSGSDHIVHVLFHRLRLALRQFHFLVDRDEPLSFYLRLDDAAAALLVATLCM